MPLPKRQPLPSKAAKPTEDSRFSSFQTSAKYRLPGKKRSKTQLDERFSRLLTDPDFYNKATHDKYGRKRDKNAGKKELEKLYVPDGQEDEEDEDLDDDLDLDTESTRRRDAAVKRELAKVDIRGKGDFIREGGLSSSSEDESSSDEEEEEAVEDQAELPEQANDVPTGEVTSRLAAVNLDWDNIKAVDIMAVANSFVPVGGSIQKVAIYVSDFGRTRIQIEDIEGPPKEIFAKSARKQDITSIDDLEGAGSEGEEEAAEVPDGEEFDSTALRSYQLDRLRYYYAIITCSSPATAKSIYDNLDGREYLSSANFFDLRFVPDDTTFDEDAHNECERVPDGYKPNEFQTTALTHSQVKLTWDADDTTRLEVQKRAFSRKEVDENELQAYIGSDSEDEPEDAAKTAALRAALGLDASDKVAKSQPKRDRDFKKPTGDMEITFSAGLSANAAKGSVFENEPIVEETTIEKWQRKQKERKQKRKARAKAIREGRDPDAEEVNDAQHAKGKDEEDEEDPWNDPFFDVDPDSAMPSKAKSKKEKREARKREEEEEGTKAAERANLELLMVDDEDSNVRHFDMNSIMKAEKDSKKRKGKKKNKGETATVDDGFNIDTNDPRFAKLYESHEFAIDPTFKAYKETAGMKALLVESRNKRKRDRDDGTGADVAKKQRSKEQESGDVEDVKKLAARVKAKTKKA